MYIIYENENNIEELRSKYLVFELDTIEFKPNEFRKAFCVVDSEHIQLQDAGSIGVKVKRHESLMQDYKIQNWDECNKAIDELMGSFKGELDSFYEIIKERIVDLRSQDLNETWNGSYKPTNTN